MKFPRRLSLVFAGTLVCSSMPAQADSSAGVQAVTVGSNGNEPIIAGAADGTLYIAALQYIYRSDDGGAHWRQLPGPDIAATVLASDSSIAVDPEGRLYMSFDYPYAGTTAVCTSDDRGDSWSCDPAVVPGGTDRMWVTAPSTKEAYCVTNEGLYQTAFLISQDRGTTWAPTQFANGTLSPQTGPLLQKPGGGNIVQAVEYSDPNDTSSSLAVYVYQPGVPATVLSEVRPAPLPYLNGLPSGGFTTDGLLYLVSEDANDDGGRQLAVTRSPDEGQAWVKLPPLPGSQSGTVTFAWLAAGKPGHVGVIYYYSPVSGDPTILDAGAPWSVMWAETQDAASAEPHWTVTKLEDVAHVGVICAALSCAGDARFAGDFINAVFDAQDHAQLTWMNESESQSTFVRYASTPFKPAKPGSAAHAASLPETTQQTSRYGGALGFMLLLPLLGAGLRRRCPP